MIKKTLMIVFAASTMIFAGCDNLPSPEKMALFSRSIGVAAGVTANATKLDGPILETVQMVFSYATNALPESDETFLEVWTPTMNEIVSKKIADGKLNDATGVIVKTVCTAAAQGLDYMFEVRWPKAKEYSDLVSIGLKNFMEGFNSIISPTNTLSAKANAVDYDEYTKALEYLQK